MGNIWTPYFMCVLLCGGGVGGAILTRRRSTRGVVPRWNCYTGLMDGFPRITIEPDKCAGAPCIRGYRIRVVDVLDLLAAGLTAEEIVEELPDLEPEDVTAALEYAIHRVSLQPAVA